MDIKARYVGIASEYDPLIPFEAGFKSSLDWLNHLENKSLSSEIIFRTRSPLVILLAPALKRFRENIKITIPIEAVNDCLHQEIDPERKLPRPLERICAAKALHHLGLKVEFEIRAFIGATSYTLPSELALSFAELCDESASTIVIRSPLSTGKAVSFFNKALVNCLKKTPVTFEPELARFAA